MKVTSLQWSKIFSYLINSNNSSHRQFSIQTCWLLVDFALFLRLWRGWKSQHHIYSWNLNTLYPTYYCYLLKGSKIAKITGCVHSFRADPGHLCRMGQISLWVLPDLPWPQTFFFAESLSLRPHHHHLPQLHPPSPLSLCCPTHQPHCSPLQKWMALSINLEHLHFFSRTL